MARAGFIVSFLFLTSVDAAIAFESGIFPGEGPHRVKAPSGEMELLKAPCAHARVAKRLSLPEGTLLKWKAVRFRTLAPGILVARESGILHGSSYGRVSYLSRDDYYSGRGSYRTFGYAEGDSIEFLQDRAEGSAFLRLKNEVVSAQLLHESADPLKEIKRPELELWIQILGEDGKELGWYRMPDATRYHPKAGSMSDGPEFLP